MSLKFSILVSCNKNLRETFLYANAQKSGDSDTTELSKIFQTTSQSFFFFTMAANDRGYGLGRSAGEFPVAIATKEMRAQRLPKAH